METKTTVQGIYSALEILIDYPGIGEIVDIEIAQQFLKKLAENNISEIPKMPQEIIDSIVKQQHDDLNSWREALEEIRMWVYEPEETDKELLIQGSFWDSLRDDSETAGYFRFYPNNLAEVIFNLSEEEREKRGDCEEKEGTWAEIFEVLNSYYKKYLSVPELPDEDDDE